MEITEERRITEERSGSGSRSGRYHIERKKSKFLKSRLWKGYCREKSKHSKPRWKAGYGKIEIENFEMSEVRMFMKELVRDINVFTIKEVARILEEIYPNI